MKDCRKTCELCTGWTLSFTHPETGAFHRIPAIVPGNVELDLERAGLLTDALPPDQGHAAHWVDLVDWTYETEFTYEGLPDGTSSAMLIFEGIDTVAEVWLNGELLKCCRNMFIAQEMEVTKKLRHGKNLLQVMIAAPEVAAHRLYPAAPPFHWVAQSREASVYLRKARHMWGWDNAPRRLSAGIWRGVRLEFLPPVRFESVYVETGEIDVAERRAEICCWYSFTTPERDLHPYQLHLTLTLHGKTAYENTFTVFYPSGWLRPLTVENAEFWYPAGYGASPLYECTLTLEKAGEAVASHTMKIGIRRIRLERSETTTPGGDGEFQFYCNDEKIYICGTNWKPLSPYHSQTPEKLHRALELARECHCNMIRVWGGGIYEEDAFFDYCDEHGILVWQDFMLACEFPPQEEFFLHEMEEEAAAVVTRFRNHPSLALWCGDNETDAAFFWPGCMQHNLLPSDNRVTREVFPRVIRNLDPGRDYLPSSPYFSSAKMLSRRIKRQHPYEVLSFAPEQHIYTDGPNLPPGGFREFFRMSAAHFSSETGPIGVNAMSETAEFVDRELARIQKFWEADPDQVPQECGFMTHQMDRYCAVWCQTARRVIEKMFGRKFSPDRPDELVAAVNYYVADLFKFIIESWRVQKFRRTGVIWWSLLDMWPMAFNYSAVDSAFRKKLPFDFIRLAQQPFAVMGKDPEQPGGAVAWFAVNDTLTAMAGEYEVTTVAGQVLQMGHFEVAPNGIARLGELAVAPGEACLLTWHTPTGIGRNFYQAPGDPYDFGFCRSLAEKVRRF